MTPTEHYRRAEELLERVKTEPQATTIQRLLAEAQVHAILSLTSAWHA